jgi:hypothetical protein
VQRSSFLRGELFSQTIFAAGVSQGEGVDCFLSDKRKKQGEEKKKQDYRKQEFKREERTRGNRHVDATVSPHFTDVLAEVFCLFFFPQHTLQQRACQYQ